MMDESVVLHPDKYTRTIIITIILSFIFIILYGNGLSSSYKIFFGTIYAFLLALFNYSSTPSP
jgi:hypothetical protein